jgi:hypothetical protein
MKAPDSVASRRTAPTAPGAAPRVTKKRVGDFALVGAGAAMAVGSIVFAGAMLLDDNHAPRINGMQYLAIFAKPRGSPPPALAQARPAAAAPRVAAAALDMAPTGAIAHGPVGPLDMAPTGAIARGPAGESAAAEPYRIVAIEPGMAWLSNDSEIRVVKPGDVVPTLGRVGSIERRDGRWALVDESGATLLATDKPIAGALGDADGPFARRMIFGDGK